MRLDELKAYEILEKRTIDALNSEGIVLKHKKKVKTKSKF